MPLVRSDSAHSSWLLSDEHPDSINDQRRIRHLSAILVHNLSLDPRRDQLAAALFGQGLVSPALDLLPTSASRPRSFDYGAAQGRAGPSADESLDNAPRGAGRRRAGSAASWNDRSAADSSRDDERRPPARVRPRRSSSAGTLLAQPSSRIDEEDPSSPSPAGDGGPSSPGAAASASTALRARSASRASVASAGSSSTIRQAPRIPPPAPQQHNERPPLPSAAQFAVREKQRRDEALRRRLVDSFVSLELVQDERVDAQSQAAARADPLEAALAGRRRSGSVASAHMQRSGSAGSAQGPGASSWASSSLALSSPRKAMRRRMTASSLLSTSASFPTLASTSAAASSSSSPRPAPFFVSPPSLASTHASFPVDPSAFLVPLDDLEHGRAARAAAAPALPDDPTTSTWPGLRESRLRAKVFARPSDALRPGASTRAGKQKAPEEDEDEWRLVAEWEVELDGLTSLGPDPTLFPSLPLNTLIFALSPSAPSFCPSASSSTSTDTEYFTAPLPLLRRAARPPRRSNAAAGARATRSLSEDEASCSSCSGSEDDDPGNLSDPGAGALSTSRARTRPRSGTLRGARLLARSRARSDPQAQAARRDEAHLRRLALLERSRRETRMVRGAGWDETRRVWVGEREAEGLREEVREVRGKVARALGEEGEGGWAERERERAEMQDRVDDLEAVKDAEQQELEEDLAALDARRAALRARRDRLEQARALDEANQKHVGAQRAVLDDQDRSLANLGSTSRTRRTQLITLLSHIFPIEPVSPSPSSKTPLPPLLFSIVGLALPNSSYPPFYTDDSLSSALGYAAHVTHLVAAYLGVPLCYPLRCRASRSVVVDEISMMKGPRAFPLYGRGVDRYRFDYGVFLLNKNIEQLMYSQGLTVLDLRNTLPNLKTLILSLSYDPSHADYLSATLLPSTVFSDAASPTSPALAGTTDAEYLVDDGAPSIAAQDEPSSATNGRSRSSSLASTIRPSHAKSASGASRTSSRSSSRRSSRTRGGSGEGADAEGRSSSPASLAEDGEPVGARAAAPDGARSERRARSGSNGRANGAAASSRAPAAAARAEKRAVPVPPPEAVPVGSSAPSPGLKVRVVKSASAHAAGDGGGRGAGGGGGGGYGARIRDGLWSAVAGNVAAAGGVSGGRGGVSDGR